MKLHRLSGAILLVVALVSCRENESEENDFVPGELIIGIKSTISIDLVFDLMNEKGVLIDQMTGFYYYSSFPNDSLIFVNNQLKKEVYIDPGFNGGSAFIHPVDNRITIVEYLVGMNSEYQTRWLDAIALLRLTDLNNDSKSLVIKVTPGKEKQWLKEFESHPYVKWVELNGYLKIGI